MKYLFTVFLLILVGLNGVQAQGGPVNLLGSGTPAIPNSGNPGAGTVGMRWYSSVDGQVIGVRFYKGTDNTGTHIGYLWTDAGSLLGSITFTGESASGWQEAIFSSPIVVTASTTYVIGYYAPNGNSSITLSYFASPVTSGVLTAPAYGSGVVNGVYGTGGAGTFPNLDPGDTDPFYAGLSYWVDVIFEEVEAEPTETTPPTETPVESETPGPSPTAEPSQTPMPNTVIYSTVIAPGEEEGQAVAFRYEMSAGDAANAVLLFILVTLGLIQLLMQMRKGS